MPTWGWAVIGVCAFVVVVLVLALVWMQRRTSHLRHRFGPEYDRTVSTVGSRRDAEAALEDRERRRERMDIRPLPRELRQRYERDWAQLQAEFVDDPFVAVASADRLIQSVMRDEGYPVEDFARRADDLSVDHPRVVENYREGHRLAVANSAREGAGTEGLRQAMQHYRTLFVDLMDTPDGRGGDGAARGEAVARDDRGDLSGYATGNQGYDRGRTVR